MRAASVRFSTRSVPCATPSLPGRPSDSETGLVTTVAAAARPASGRPPPCACTGASGASRPRRSAAVEISAERSRPALQSGCSAASTATIPAASAAATLVPETAA